MEKMQRVHKSKILISLLVAVLLVFSFEHNRPKAVLPIVAGVLGGIVIEEMASMGIKWATKNIGKKKADEWAEAFAANPANKFDFEGMNPYLNKDGSVYITPSAMDRAKIASLIAGAVGGVAIENALGEREMQGGSVGDASFKFATLGSTSKDICAYHFVVSNTYKRTDVEGYKFYVQSKTTGRAVATFPTHYTGHDGVVIVGHNESSNSIQIFNTHGTADNYGLNDAYRKYIGYCGNVKSDDGMYYPKTLNNVYNIDNSVTNNYVLPNQKELENRPIIIYNVLPPSENEGEVTWGDIRAHFGSDEEFHAKIEAGVSHYAENGDINNTTWNDAVINNYYTDINYDKKKEDVEKEIGELEPVDPGDNLPSDPVEVEPVDRSLLVVAKESYNYLADTVKTSVDGLTAVTAGAAGIITFLGTTMGWLPDEWIVMFSAAFGLGLFAFFFRR